MGRGLSVNRESGGVVPLSVWGAESPLNRMWPRPIHQPYRQDRTDRQTVRKDNGPII